MVKRPQIQNEDLYDHVMQLHREYTGSSAENFETALETVTKLAENHITGRDQQDPNWYPGKYMSDIVNRLSGAGSSTDYQETPNRPADAQSYRVDPNEQIVFKTILDKEHQITVPEAEVAAFDIESGDLMQVIMYSLESDE